MNSSLSNSSIVMAGLVPAIHGIKDVDARVRPAHDG